MCSSAIGENDYSLPPALDLQLDKSVFKRKEIFFAVGLPLGREFKNICSKIQRFGPGYISLPKFNKIYEDSNGIKRKLVPVRSIEDPKDWEFLRELNIDIPEAPDEEIRYLKSHPDAALIENCSPNQGGLDNILPSKPSAFRLSIDYENITFERAIKTVLPPDMDSVTSFSLVGHVAHFNLKPAALPYRKLIGQIVIDKLPHVRTVVNKAAKIDTEFRTFAVDLMAGEENYLTEVKENGVTFHLDFSKVYWNSRLGTEHTRIVDEIKGVAKLSETKPVVVYDVFAGVGPFSLPLARSDACEVLANDLNPVSFHFLKENVRKNSSRKHPLTEDKIQCFNLDGREFIKQVVLPHFETALQSDVSRFFMLMNLPGLAIEFLDVFRDFCLENGTSRPIHTRCYCFIRHTLEGGTSKALKHQEADTLARERVCGALGIDPASILLDNSQCTSSLPCGIHLTSWNVRFVRNTAPLKDMYCLEFDLQLPCDRGSKRPRIE
ncbi:unnamed protein product [Rodentolepis nana]|uniref:tRNA (guanine(37)-N1)-methyltransferase n=1 Tax=Rodentolepis nana TaxID=102285 RepID=A0A0R3T138_RODNA|nr:unnamed protein product [Rodentolepis nana]